MMRRYHVVVTTSAIIEIDDAVFKEVADPEWQGTFYHLPKKEDVAAHVGYNLLRGADLTQLDGFVSLKDSMARIIPGTLEGETEATQIKRR